MRSAFSLFLVAFALLLGGCEATHAGEDTAAEGPLVLDALALDAAPGSLAPDLSVGPDGTVYATWIDPMGEAGHALRFATYAPGASAWSAPKTIAEGANWFVNWADVPALAVAEDGRLAAHWLAENGAGKYAYGIQTAASTDGGATWSAPVWLHDDAAPVEHGFVSMVPTGGGTLQAVWLDGRKFAEDVHEMTFRTRTLAADGTLGPETVLDDRICDCCPSDAIALPGGGALAVYRGRTEGEVRDIYRVRFDGTAWGKPARIHEDGWVIPGCPVNGPAADGRGEAVAVAWFTGANDEAKVQVAFSKDGGETFGPPTRVDLGQPAGRVDVVMADDGAALVSWIEGSGTGEAAGIYLRRVAPDGTAAAPRLVRETSTARTAGYPRMIATGNELVFAWTEPGDTRRVHAAVFRGD